MRAIKPVVVETVARTARIVRRISGLRRYPKIVPGLPEPSRPISFIVVRFSDEYLHNIVLSECVQDPLNELVVVDNTAGLNFDTLALAVSSGIERTKHDLIAVVHEDVLFPSNWHSQFEASLASLESIDPQWALLGAVGWRSDGALCGQWSDPHRYENTFGDTPYEAVERLDEQLMILHRERLVDVDLLMPSIHHLGRDLPRIARQKSQLTYVVQAPTIHKFADAEGRRIRRSTDSSKLSDRDSLSYLAERACADEYIVRKWPEIGETDADFGKTWVRTGLDLDATWNVGDLDSPVILLARGGSGSRLLAAMASDVGVFLGNDQNRSGDALEMVPAVYQAIVEQHRCPAPWQQAQVASRLRSGAARMLEHRGRTDELWGFKVPESLILVEDLLLAFPGARFVHMVRDPLATCLRRTHKTARLDNSTGRISMALAYDHCGIDRREILDDSPAMHMAYTTTHQLDLVENALGGLPESSVFEFRFEDLVESPQLCADRLTSWLGIERRDTDLADQIDLSRLQNPSVVYSDDVARRVEDVLQLVRDRLGYC